jgi:hypothetical protein
MYNISSAVQQMHTMYWKDTQLQTQGFTLPMTAKASDVKGNML